MKIHRKCDSSLCPIRPANSCLRRKTESSGPSWQPGSLSKCETTLSHDKYTGRPGERLEAGENRNDLGDLLHSRHPIEAAHHKSDGGDEERCSIDG